MKKKTLTWLTMVACLILAVAIISCSGSGSSSAQNNTVDDDGSNVDPNGNVQLTTIPLNETPTAPSKVQNPYDPPYRAVTPPYDPNVAWGLGDAAHPAYWIDGSVADWSSFIQPDYTLSVNLELAYWTPYTLAYVYANYPRANGITLTLDGTAYTPDTYMSAGDPVNYDTFPYLCFTMKRDETGATWIEGYPSCTEQLYTLRVLVTGDDNNNGVVDAPYDHPMVPLDGTETIFFQTSLFYDDTYWGQMTWDASLNAFAETLPSIASGQKFWLHVSRPYIGPIDPPPDDPVPVLGGVWLQVINPSTGAVLGQTHLVHWIDGATNPDVEWPTVPIDSINTGTNEPVNQWCDNSTDPPSSCDSSDNRGDFVGLP